FPKEDKAFRKWIRVTIDPAVYENVQEELESNLTTRRMLRTLRKRFAASATQTREEARREYHKALQSARRANQSAEKWHSTWMTALNRAKNAKLTEIEGNQGIADFLDAISARYAPNWATRKREEIFEAEVKGRELSQTLEISASQFLAITRNAPQTKKHQAHAILGQIPSEPAEQLPPLKYLYMRPGTNFKHKHSPEECVTLEYAIIGQRAEDCKIRISKS
ncbi:uncharacterized protein F5Z01DRAFT_641267, partial [Emericellopsis atlantica]